MSTEIIFDCSDDLDTIIDEDILPGPPAGGNMGVTKDGVKLPSLPTTAYSYDPIDYFVRPDHKSNGSFRESFLRRDRDLNSVLIGGYIKCEAPSDEEIVGQLGGGVHSDSDNGKAGRCYNICLKMDGTLVRVLKENPHSQYHDTGIQRTLTLGNRSNRYTGVMFMKVNQFIEGKECVRCLCWVDIVGMSDDGTFNASAQDWKLVLDATDKGQWHDHPWLTTATPGNSTATIRTNQQDDEIYNNKFCFCCRVKGGPTY